MEQIDLRLTGGGPELLQPNWAFTPAPVGSNAYQYNDGFGTGVDGLLFSGTHQGNFDIFSQPVPTVVGDSYTISFLFSNYPSPYNAPSELQVSVKPVTSLDYVLGVATTRADVVRGAISNR